jgi:hypothetical protein
LRRIALIEGSLIVDVKSYAKGRKERGRRKIPLDEDS